jgi:hypothetical protein
VTRAAEEHVEAEVVTCLRGVAEGRLGDHLARSTADASGRVPEQHGHRTGLGAAVHGGVRVPDRGVVVTVAVEVAETVGGPAVVRGDGGCR